MHGYLRICVDGRVTRINNRHVESVAVVGKFHGTHSSAGHGVHLKSRAGQEDEKTGGAHGLVFHLQPNNQCAKYPSIFGGRRVPILLTVT